MAAGAPAIRVRGVTKTFGEGTAAVQALRGVSMDIYPGQLVMLVGPSGCGKTTLVSVISGVLDADAGEVEVFGTRWSDLRPDERAARRGELVGFVFQQFNLIPTLTIEENVSVPLILRGMGHAEAGKKARAVLEAVGLGGRASARPSQLSGGMQQRVAIARALANQPALLLADEPTGNLDHHTAEEVFALLERLVHEMRLGALIATHNLELARRMDRMVTIEDGVLVELS